MVKTRSRHLTTFLPRTKTKSHAPRVSLVFCNPRIFAKENAPLCEFLNISSLASSCCASRPMKTPRLCPRWRLWAKRPRDRRICPRRRLQLARDRHSAILQMWGFQLLVPPKNRHFYLLVAFCYFHRRRSSTSNPRKRQNWRQRNQRPSFPILKAFERIRLNEWEAEHRSRRRRQAQVLSSR